MFSLDQLTAAYKNAKSDLADAQARVDEAQARLDRVKKALYAAIEAN